MDCSSPLDPRPSLFFLRNAARDEKNPPQDSRWDSDLRPQSPSPAAAAAASGTGASRIDRSDISLHPPAAAGEGALLCFRGRMNKGRGGRVTGKAARTEENFHARGWTEPRWSIIGGDLAALSLSKQKFRPSIMTVARLREPPSLGERVPESPGMKSKDLKNVFPARLALISDFTLFRP